MKYARKIGWLLSALVPGIALAGSTLTIDGTVTAQPSHFTVDRMKQAA